jgi:hypothetical protein
MILEKVDEASLHTLSKIDCNKYLSYLRYSLGKEREKAVLNEKRRAIHLIENRLRKLNENR